MMMAASAHPGLISHPTEGSPSVLSTVLISPDSVPNISLKITLATTGGTRNVANSALRIKFFPHFIEKTASAAPSETTSTRGTLKMVIAKVLNRAL